LRMQNGKLMCVLLRQQKMAKIFHGTLSVNEWWCVCLYILQDECNDVHLTNNQPTLFISHQSMRAFSKMDLFFFHRECRLLPSVCFGRKRNCIERQDSSCSGNIRLP
jgi:hypothetical protein